MNIKNLMELCKKVDPMHQVYLRVGDERRITTVSAWIDDGGFLIIEEHVVDEEKHGIPNPYREAYKLKKSLEDKE